MQLFKSRRKHLRTSKEEKRWGQLSYQYMSEESDANDGEKVNRHPLEWHSESWVFIIVLHMCSYLTQCRIEQTCCCIRRPGNKVCCQKLFSPQGESTEVTVFCPTTSWWAQVDFETYPGERRYTLVPNTTCEPGHDQDIVIWWGLQWIRLNLCWC